MRVAAFRFAEAAISRRCLKMRGFCTAERRLMLLTRAMNDRHACFDEARRRRLLHAKYGVERRRR